MTQRKISLLLLLFFPLIVGFGEVNQEAASLSLINLIATPEKYHGKFVRVIGVTNIEFEGSAIYLSKEDLIHGVTKNALWLTPNYKALGTTEKELSKDNGNYVLVEGVFNMNDNGHMSLLSGSIVNITRFDQWTYLTKQR